MEAYAIIKLAGKQYKVKQGDIFTVDRLDQEEGQEFTVSDVLMTGSENSQQIGTPQVKGASVTLKILENSRSKKLLVGKFRAKSRYRRAKGHRQHESTVEVVKITA